MNINNTVCIYFSPTGTTKKVLDIFNKSFSTLSAEYDLTGYENSIELLLDQKSFVIFAFPVYNGRVPKTFLERLKNIYGNNTLCIIIATYGNRGYADSLLEMQNVAERHGFRVMGAVSVVSEHSVVRTVASGRPNENDISVINMFCKELLLKLEEPQTAFKSRLPGKDTYRKYRKMTMAPVSTSDCSGCKLCSKICSTGAISFDFKCHTDKKKCISCMRCVKYCPHKARKVSSAKERIAEVLLRSAAKNNNKSEIFFL